MQATSGATPLVTRRPSELAIGHATLGGGGGNSTGISGSTIPVPVTPSVTAVVSVVRASDRRGTGAVHVPLNTTPLGGAHRRGGSSASFLGRGAVGEASLDGQVDASIVGVRVVPNAASLS